MYELLLKISNPVGIIGVIFILIAYFFISQGRWRANSWRYQLFNFLGAWLILFSLYFHWNLASVLIEIAWLIISLMGMWRLLGK